MNSLTMYDVAVRLGLTLVTALVIGFERESHGRAAGLRTTVLAALAAALAMIISGELFVEGAAGSASWRPDPARLAAGILAGMGFLGAGAIIREGNMVRGVTTAAVMWFVTILGLAFGSGLIGLGLIGWGLALVTLFLLPKLESQIRNDWYGAVTVRVKLDGISADEVRSRLERHDLKVKKVELHHDLEHHHKTMRFELKYKKTDLFALSRAVMAELDKGDGVYEVKWM
jgi:putative Mg2+ transporter-C (MgtC) family protein